MILILGICCAVLSVANLAGAVVCAFRERYLPGTLMLLNFALFGAIVQLRVFG